SCLLDSALDPVLNEALNQPIAAEAEAAILNLKICDPACGSGHFLVAAAHRVAKRLAAVRTGDEEPDIEALRHALRDVVSHCIYGVDINPMAVELCKVSLWMESIEPGKPLSFLDAHIQCGNSLLGTTPALLKGGIPDEAFEPIEGDDRKMCSNLKKLNRKFREGNQTLSNDGEERVFSYQNILRESIAHLDAIDNQSVQGVYRQQQEYNEHIQSIEYRHSKLWADAWCAAFVWKKRPDALYPFTQDDFLALKQGIEYIDESQRRAIERLAAQYQFFHWHLAFPKVFCSPGKNEVAKNEQTGWSGGFDVVLGNPPWERIKIQEKEWFAARRPDIANAANAAQRKRMIGALALSPNDKERALHSVFLEDRRKAEGESALIRRSGFYPLCGRGDVNTYSLFTECMRTIIDSHRRVGCIVPSGIATDDTTKYFFQDLMEKRSLVSLHSFENREKLFAAVDSRYSFSLLSLTGPERPVTQGTDFVFFALQVENLQDKRRRFTLSAENIELMNPNTKTSPIFGSARDAELNLAIYKKVPVLINEQTGVNDWSAYYMRLVDLGDHTEYLKFSWETRSGDWNVPLYEAKLFHAFDHRFSTFEDVSQEKCIAGQPRELASEDKNNPHLKAHSRYFLPNEFANDLFGKYPTYNRSWLLLWRDVARATDERSCISTVIPKVVASRKCPALGFSATDNFVGLLTNLNSFIFDYTARQKLGSISFSFYILKQLPVLPPAAYTPACCWDSTCTLRDWILPRALELTYTSWDLEAFAKDCGYDGPPFRWDEERRFLLRCELDAAYFHLYGITRDDVDYIMETFPIVRREDEKQHGEYRTKRVILEIYDKIQRAINAGVAYETRLVPGPADPAVAHEVQ
ncbi:MAG TPA: DNA methyltransferase, partial [Ktedonobacteraceae bacterium]|nr:DNA methyltransferase [Ktedonobacteraceae bacterium]